MTRTARCEGKMARARISKEYGSRNSEVRSQNNEKTSSDGFWILTPPARIQNSEFRIKALRAITTSHSDFWILTSDFRTLGKNSEFRIKGLARDHDLAF